VEAAQNYFQAAIKDNHLPLNHQKRQQKCLEIYKNALIYLEPVNKF